MELLYIKWYIKDEKGARKRIYNKADNTICSTFIALHLADMLVKHKQANHYTDNRDEEMTRYGFSLALESAFGSALESALGLALGKAFFLYTFKVFASKWAREDFPCNGKQSAWTHKGTASDYK